jgi:hypothetical protein
MHEVKNAYKIPVGKLETKTLLGGPRHSGGVGKAVPVLK